MPTWSWSTGPTPVDRADTGQATAAGAGVVFPWQPLDAPPAWQALGVLVADHYPRLVETLAGEGAGDEIADRSALRVIRSAERRPVHR